MQDVAARIGDIEISLEKIKQLAQNVQEKPSESQVDAAPTFNEHIKTLVRLQELLEDTSDKIRELPRFCMIDIWCSSTKMFDF